MQLGLGWIFVGAYAVENGRSIDIALLPASSLYSPPIFQGPQRANYGTFSLHRLQSGLFSSAGGIRTRGIQAPAMNAREVNAQ